MAYRPRPIDTTHAELPHSLLPLAEQLAENAHELWARRRMAEGWTLGAVRDEGLKHHPGLVPYGELPEGEKQSDRDGAIESIKAILALGYQVIAPEPSGETVESMVIPRLRTLAASGAGVDSLLALWQPAGAEGDDPGRRAEAYRKIGEALLKRGEPLLAFDVVAEGLKRCAPGDPRLRQLQALALARSGAVDQANAILTELVEQGHDDVETLGLLARTHKDLAVRDSASRPDEAREHLKVAFQHYERAYRNSGNTWPGINAAALAVLHGRGQWARDVAATLRERSLEELRRAENSEGGETFWPLATLGEAALILGGLGEAEDWYTRAVHVAEREKRFGDLASTRRQALLLLGHLGRDSGSLDRCLRLPRVAVLTGHMIDRPERAEPRFPPDREPAVKAAILEHLERSGARIGYASAACGSDLIFLETILELGGEAHVVLPYAHEQFLRDSVEIVPGSQWGERFDEVLRKSKVTVASKQRLEHGGISYDFANRYLYGLSTIHAQQLQTELLRLAVWNGRPGDGPGGTADVVASWRLRGFEVGIIDPAGTSGDSDAIRTVPEAIAPPRDGGPSDAKGSQIVAILFADVVKFSSLTEPQLPLFVEHFLGLVAEELAELPREPLKKNTWGDGLFFVFGSIEDAGKFALDLSDRVRKRDWKAFGLPPGLNLRIALHAGPILHVEDPVTGHENCIGTHVSHAARIEPITPPGQVFASQAFAALAASEHVEEFACHYVGRTPLAKGHGTYPTYHVNRLRPAR